MKVQEGMTKLEKYAFHPIDIMGKGATGNVCRGFRLEDGGRVAIKAIEMKQVSNDVTKYLLEGEKTAMSTIKSPFVVMAEDIVQDKDYCYIVMQLCSGGTLKDYIKKRGKLQECEAIDIFRKIVTGYVAISEAKIIHRDLKTANVMMRYNKTPAIIDFGYCEMILGKRPLVQYNLGSPSYMAPEVHFKSRYSQKSDIWALGVILHEMLTGKPLDAGMETQPYFNQLKQSKVAPYNRSAFSEIVQSIFDKAFITNPEERATALKIKYIIDKAVMGKLPPLDAEGKPIVFPTNDTSKKEMNFATNVRISTQSPRFHPERVNKSSSQTLLYHRSMPQNPNNAVISSFSAGERLPNQIREQKQVWSPTQMLRRTQQTNFMIGNAERRFPPNISNQEESPKLVHKPISIPTQIVHPLEKVRSEKAIKIQRAF